MGKGVIWLTSLKNVKNCGDKRKLLEIILLREQDGKFFISVHFYGNRSKNVWLVLLLKTPDGDQCAAAAMSDDG